MSLLNIITAPSKILKYECDEISNDRFGKELDLFMSSMLETMYANGGVGLAGPQVGVSERIIVADMSEGRSEASVKMVNPKILSSSEKTIKIREGCLSIPGFEADVDRAWEVVVEYQTPLGEKLTEKLSGYFSVVIQHEIDHLDGVTLLEKTGRVARKMYLTKIKKRKKKFERMLKKHSRLV
jgi:peptide deformylase